MGKRRWIWDNSLRLISVFYLYTIIAFAIATKEKNLFFIIPVGTILALYPIWTLWFLMRNRDILVKRGILEKYWALYGNLKYKQTASLLYPFLSISRKIMFAGGAILLT